MKAKDCIKKGIRLAKIGINKATSYQVVKSRLNYRLYNDEFLQDRIQYEKHKASNGQEA